MANFGGHAIPGTFFLFYGFWLTVKHTLLNSWRSAGATAGRHPPPPRFRKLDLIEGGVTIFAAFVGIMVEQFVPDGPHARLSAGESWVKLMNWQHSTMYLFFGIFGVALVSSTRSKLVPLGVDRLALSMALFVEGFLFYYHVHSRPPLDAHIHTLLLVAVFGGSASTMLEVFIRDHYVLELLRAGLFILQGSWFFQIGFVLYPLSGPEWDLTLHDNLMFITMCFCWHLAVALLLVTLTTSMVLLITKGFRGKLRDVEIGLRNTSTEKNCQKALLEESDEE